MIQSRLANPIATGLLDGTIPRGSAVQVDWDEAAGRFTFTPVEATAPAGA